MSAGPQLTLTKILSPLVIGSLVVGIVAGLGIEYALTQPAVLELQTAKERLEAKTDQLEDENLRVQSLLASVNGTLSSTTIRLAEKEKDLSVALNNLRLNETEVATLRQTLNQVRAALTRLDNDRSLLIDLRRETPLVREEARSFWEAVKVRAVRVDASLTPVLDKILRSLDGYFSWIEAFPGGNATNAQIGAWYNSITLSVLDYIDGQDEFRSDALLVVITHLDQAVGLLG